eukprot:TRINITY_DN6438_c0_g1_i1.p1 TRINITY_DN6438_c0_g1~~TRINITY_DN6438_c0_g1_i1.p1  ORF type:complete len:660 (+),score=124.87 TRINITY_DN6438_c0_g1_i1:98-1981(+)
MSYHDGDFHLLGWVPVQLLLSHGTWYKEAWELQSIRTSERAIGYIYSDSCEYDQLVFDTLSFDAPAAAAAAPATSPPPTAAAAAAPATSPPPTGAAAAAPATSPPPTGLRRLLAYHRARSGKLVTVVSYTEGCSMEAHKAKIAAAAQSPAADVVLPAFTEESLWRWAIEALRELAALHRRGLVHGCVSLDALVLDMSGGVSLSDAGIRPRNLHDPPAPRVTPEDDVRCLGEALTRYCTGVLGGVDRLSGEMRLLLDACNDFHEGCPSPAAELLRWQPLAARLAVAHYVTETRQRAMQCAEQGLADWRVEMLRWVAEAERIAAAHAIPLPAFPAAWTAQLREQMEAAEFHADMCRTKISRAYLNFDLVRKITKASGNSDIDFPSTPTYFRRRKAWKSRMKTWRAGLQEYHHVEVDGAFTVEGETIAVEDLVARQKEKEAQQAEANRQLQRGARIRKATRRRRDKQAGEQDDQSGSEDSAEDIGSVAGSMSAAEGEDAAQSAKDSEHSGRDDDGADTGQSEPEPLAEGPESDTGSVAVEDSAGSAKDDELSGHEDGSAAAAGPGPIQRTRQIGTASPLFSHQSPPEAGASGVWRCLTCGHMHPPQCTACIRCATHLLGPGLLGSAGSFA